MAVLCYEMYRASTERTYRPCEYRLVVAALLTLVTSLAQAQLPESAPDVPKARVPPDEIPAPTSQTTAPVASTPSKEQCMAAHRDCQQARNIERLVQARQLAKVCVSQTCPDLLVSDCAKWLDELDEQIPSVVFQVRLDGQVNSRATVNVDGRRFDSWASGEALRLDPGEHAIVFLLTPFAPIHQVIVVAEGVKYRAVSAEFKSLTSPNVKLVPSNAQSSQGLPAAHIRPVPSLVYPLLGISAVGLAGFVSFGLAGNAEHSRLKNSCAPFCTDDEVRTMRQRYLVGDISLGIGLAAIVSAGVLYVTRPEHAAEPKIGLSMNPTGASATLTLGGF